MWIVQSTTNDLQLQYEFYNLPNVDVKSISHLFFSGKLAGKAQTLWCNVQHHNSLTVIGRVNAGLWLGPQKRL